MTTDPLTPRSQTQATTFDRSQATRIEHEFDGVVELTVIQDLTFDGVLDTLNVRFYFSDWMVPLTLVDSFSFNSYKFFSTSTKPLLTPRYLRGRFNTADSHPKELKRVGSISADNLTVNVFNTTNDQLAAQYSCILGSLITTRLF